MTETIEAIRQKEMLLEREIEQVEEEARKLAQIGEDYKEFFHQTATLFSEIEDQFTGNDFSWFLNDQSDSLRHQTYHILTDIEEEAEQLKKQKHKIETKQSHLFYQRKALYANKEEVTHEH